MKQKLFVIGAFAIGVLAVAVFLRSTTEATKTPHPIEQQYAATETEISVAPSVDALAESPSSLPAQPGTEIVMGIPVLKERNCTVTRHYIDLGNGIVTEAFSCVPHEKVPGEYDLYSNDELAVLAYSDAKAASTLGKRLIGRDSRQSREWMLRAVALEPGNVEPVMWLASQAYSLRGDSKAAKIATANAYVITNTARALGSTADIDWIVEDLQQAGFSEEGFAFLDKSVKSDLRTIRDIQLDVFGHSTIEEELL